MLVAPCSGESPLQEARTAAGQGPGARPTVGHLQGVATGRCERLRLAAGCDRRITAVPAGHGAHEARGAALVALVARREVSPSRPVPST